MDFMYFPSYIIHSFLLIILLSFAGLIPLSSKTFPTHTSKIPQSSPLPPLSLSIYTHMTNDARRMAVKRAATFNGVTLSDLVFIRRLGSGDIGSVFLAELKCASGYTFAAKVMDKEELKNRGKEGRAKVEREILEMLNHPFLPTLYATLESPKWACLLTDFCPGGDLHILRQRQPDRRFLENAVRFYVSEVIVALEYLHMKGVVYRDLKPENVLVQSDGHVMLTDFDLSLKCIASKATAQIISYESKQIVRPSNNYYKSFIRSSCILPDCIVPPISCLNRKDRQRKRINSLRGSYEIVTEPVEARSMSFVGTHEYLAPEIVSGKGHSNSVDWWTLGVLTYELLYGVTPFKGADNEFTMDNILARELQFPKEPIVSGQVKDLITRLLTKDPTKRMGSIMGATAIKKHAFFNEVNWALLRCAPPPFTPRPVVYKKYDPEEEDCSEASIEYY